MTRVLTDWIDDTLPLTLATLIILARAAYALIAD